MGTAHMDRNLERKILIPHSTNFLFAAVPSPISMRDGNTRQRINNTFLNIITIIITEVGALYFLFSSSYARREEHCVYGNCCESIRIIEANSGCFEKGFGINKWKKTSLRSVNRILYNQIAVFGVNIGAHTLASPSNFRSDCYCCIKYLIPKPRIDTTSKIMTDNKVLNVYV